MTYAKDYSLDTTPAPASLQTAVLKQPKIAVLGSAESKFVVKELGFPVVDIDKADIIFDDAGKVTKENLVGKEVCWYRWMVSPNR
ncbi:hypothetical protein LIS82_01315 [Cytobacillus solani]|uniref:Uncharacterized protein n=1 Tax=Cytobacillus solani TaxID=1637975 RepID=A0A0Q3VRH8_9BACI|nr:hypothetical protein [Cytobacillus solani]KQL27571.1 hypothetical protein AN957_01150 [Cytobacillus solani]USK55280.1 hypothetical protein LIS82_01315 [Cytobacillus solani]